MSAPLPPPSPRWAYFLDLDGTLLEFLDDPSPLHRNGQLPAMLAGLHRATEGAVAVISGRSLEDIDRVLGENGPRLPAAGQHGSERRDADGLVSRHEPSLEPLEHARVQLARAIEGRAGLLLERKSSSVALHYRRAPRLGGYAHRLVRSVARAFEPEFSIQPGKRVVELKPSGRDKGVAVLEFIREPPFSGRLPVFLGDDATDEYGFATVNQLGGHSVKVGRGRTVAAWRLRDVAAVWSWLGPLTGALA